MRFTDRVLSLHPALVTIGLVLLFACGGVAVGINPHAGAVAQVLWPVSMLLLLGTLLLWHYSLYRAASDRNAARVGHRGRRGVFFLLAIVGLAAHEMLFPVLMLATPTDAAYQMLTVVTSLSMLAGCLAWFAAIWTAANAIHAL